MRTDSKSQPHFNWSDGSFTLVFGDITRNYLPMRTANDDKKQNSKWSPPLNLFVCALSNRNLTVTYTIILYVYTSRCKIQLMEDINNIEITHAGIVCKYLCNQNK